MYKRRDVDEIEYPFYYGYVNARGDWYIVRVSEGGSVKYSWRPEKSRMSYFEAWDDREKLRYNFGQMF